VEATSKYAAEIMTDAPAAYSMLTVARLFVSMCTVFHLPPPLILELLVDVINEIHSVKNEMAEKHFNS